MQIAEAVPKLSGVDPLHAIPDTGLPVFTASGSSAIEFFDFGNFGETLYMTVIQSDGSVWQVDMTTLVASEMTGAY